MRAQFPLRNLLAAITLFALFLGGRALIYGTEAFMLKVHLLAGLLAALVALRVSWSIPKPWRMLSVAVLSGALTATLVALAIGVEIAEFERRTGSGYFEWRRDGFQFAILIATYTINGALVGFVIATVQVVWRFVKR
jgi:hypothetical protein